MNDLLAASAIMRSKVFKIDQDLSNFAMFLKIFTIFNGQFQKLFGVQLAI